MMLNVENLAFSVNDDRSVVLHMDPVSVVVCDTPEDFAKVKAELIRQLNLIDDELKKYFA